MLIKMKQKFALFFKKPGLKTWLVYGLILTIIVSFGFRTKQQVSAASSRLYPSYCLGGWQNPQNAGGEPSLSQNAGDSEFNGSNSAVLDKSVAQIFCGYFPTDSRTNPPDKVSLHLSWSIQVPPQAQQDILPPSEEAVSASTTPDATSGQPEPKSNPQPVDPVLTVPDTAPPAVQPVSPPQEEQVSPDPSPAPGQNSPAGSNSDGQAQSFWEKLIPAARAQEMSADELSQALQRQSIPENGAVPASGFLQISYSFNGNDWIFLNRINAGNWKNFTQDIPVANWQDLQNLQIAIAAAPSLDAQPAVYLDGLWLEVEYDRTFTEALSDMGNAVTDTVGTLADDMSGAIQEVTDTVQEALTDQPAQQDEQTATTTPEMAQATSSDQQLLDPEILGQATPTPEVIKERKLLFTAGQNAAPAQKLLPWYSRDDIRRLGGEKVLAGTAGQLPRLVQSADKKSLSVSGGCSKNYFVVLLYRDRDDYLNNPASYVVNSAYKCERGSFSFNLNKLSPDLPDGKYYLLIAEEDANTTWVPVSQLIEVQVDSIMEEVQ